VVELTRADNIAWRRFLATQSGINGMLSLRERIPSVTKFDQSGIIFDAGRTQGYKEALDAISEVIGVVEEKQQELENK
jgi:hypothetical protein